MAVVLSLLWRIDSHQRPELGRLSVGRGADLHLLAGRKVSDQLTNAGNLEDLFAGQLERLRTLPGQELQRKNAIPTRFERWMRS